MSGFTRVTCAGEFYELALSTPNMNFLPNPDGSSPEQGYHSRAKDRFEGLFARHADFIAAQMATFRSAFADRVVFRPFDTDARRVRFSSLPVGVEIAVAAPPSEALRDEMERRLRELFTRRAQLVTADYEVRIEVTALDDEVPPVALEQTLADARADLDAAVRALRAQAPQILPYAGAAPFPFAIRLDVPRGAELLLTLAKEPTNAEQNDLCDRLRALQRKPARKRSWLARWFS